MRVDFPTSLPHLPTVCSKSHRVKSVLPFLLLVLSLPAAFAQDRAEMERRLAALPAAPSVIDSAGIDAFKLNGAGASAKTVPVEGQAFSSAIHIHTTTKPAKPYAIQFAARTTGPIKKGDVLLATFWARGIEHSPDADESRTEFVLELGHEPYTKSGVLPAALDRGWSKYYVPCSAMGDIAAGEGTVGFRCGYDPQVIEIAALTVRNFGTAVDLKALPYTPTNYTGRAPDAAWRAAAAERIEKLRKGDLAITVTDAAGKPVPGANVRAVQTKHAFGWGTAVDAKQLLADDPDADGYRKVLLADFNKAVIENHLKWACGRTIARQARRLWHGCAGTASPCAGIASCGREKRIFPRMSSPFSTSRRRSEKASPRTSRTRSAHFAASSPSGMC